MNATNKGWVPDYIRNSNKSIRKRPTTYEKNVQRIWTGGNGNPMGKKYMQRY